VRLTGGVGGVDRSIMDYIKEHCFPGKKDEQ
jgi:hypothetical protein